MNLSIFHSICKPIEPKFRTKVNNVSLESTWLNKNDTANIAITHKMFTAFGERSLVFNALPSIYLSDGECLEDVNCIPGTRTSSARAETNPWSTTTTKRIKRFVNEFISVSTKWICRIFKRTILSVTLPPSCSFHAHRHIRIKILKSNAINPSARRVFFCADDRFWLFLCPRFATATSRF